MYFANVFICFNVDVNRAKMITIMHCPNAKKNSKPIENSMFVDIVAIAIMLAKIGEEQGLAANAKKAPTRKGKINKLPDFFSGIFFIIVGNCMSKNPIRFNPIKIIIDENIRIIIGEAILVKALPVRAHIIPIMLKINDKPKEKESICISNFLLLSFEYPPT